MKFSAIACAAAALALGVSAVQVNVGTIDSDTDLTAQDLLVVLQDENTGSQPLNGGNVQAVLSRANLPSPFTEVSCTFTAQQGPPSNSDPPTPTCDLDTEVAFASTQEGFSPLIVFDPKNRPFCVFCQLEQTAPSKMIKRDL
ncbi:hypothetical protein H2200_013432 [Cladophialophora chaetospira]|uniref:Uncharacterized protein n=1 Tax=Cladophialophora chaetospira TaxID=386627 RepID=A0AA38UDY4_9EURO|nr:hypothetical protein H2200_013432 [Cladophialophora chaetospira]